MVVRRAILRRKTFISSVVSWWKFSYEHMNPSTAAVPVRATPIPVNSICLRDYMCTTLLATNLKCAPQGSERKQTWPLGMKVCLRGPLSMPERGRREELGEKI